VHYLYVVIFKQIRLIKVLAYIARDAFFSVILVEVSYIYLVYWVTAAEKEPMC